MAALASNPDLGCTGESLKVATTWGVFADVYCPGKESTFVFLQDVLDEVMALFPSPYIHIGGDEVPKDRWRACESCQALMRREGLADEEELQAWFVARIGKYLASHGRRLIGWNEILNGGSRLGDATIQSWQDSSWTRRAVLAGHDVIASPSEWTYLNRSARELTLERVYAFEPVPADFDAASARRVLGGETPLWSEHIVSPANLDLMAFPRVLAFADVMWSSGPRDFASLQARLDADHLPRLRAMGVAVGPADRDLLRSRSPMTPDTRGRAHPHRPGAWRGGPHDPRRPPAERVFADRRPTGTTLGGDGRYRLQAFVGRDPILGERTLNMERHRATGATVRLVTPPDKRYPGTGDWTLTDGLRGSLDHADGLWQGWLGPDVDAVVDLGIGSAGHQRIDGIPPEHPLVDRDAVAGRVVVVVRRRRSGARRSCAGRYSRHARWRHPAAVRRRPAAGTRARYSGSSGATPVRCRPAIRARVRRRGSSRTRSS